MQDQSERVETQQQVNLFKQLGENALYGKLTNHRKVKDVNHMKRVLAGNDKILNFIHRGILITIKSINK